MDDEIIEKVESFFDKRGLSVSERYLVGQRIVKEYEDCLFGDEEEEPPEDEGDEFDEVVEDEPEESDEDVGDVPEPDEEEYETEFEDEVPEPPKPKKKVSGASEGVKRMPEPPKPQSKGKVVVKRPVVVRKAQEDIDEGNF